MDLAQPHRDASCSIPTGVTAIAIAFFVDAAYLGLIGLIMLASPGTVSMALGAPLLNGLELAGPYMFLLMSGVGALIGWGLLRLNNWARRVAALAALIGVVMLVPSVSASAITLQLGNLAWGGLGIIVRVMIVWYLYQSRWPRDSRTRPETRGDSRPRLSGRAKLDSIRTGETPVLHRSGCG